MTAFEWEIGSELRMAKRAPLFISDPPYFAQKTPSAKWLAVCPPSRKNEKHKSMCSCSSEISGSHLTKWTNHSKIPQCFYLSTLWNIWVVAHLGLKDSIYWVQSQFVQCAIETLRKQKERKVLHVAHHEGGHMLEIVAKRKLKVIVNFEPNKPFWTKFESGKVKSGFLHYWNSWCSSIL